MVKTLFLGAMMAVTPQAGDAVDLEGQVATAPAQHLIQVIPGKRAAYVEFPELGQWVVYSTSVLPKQALVRVRGVVTTATGRAKRASDPSSLSESQVDAESVTVLPAADLFESWATAAAGRDARRNLLLGQGKALVPLLLEHLNDDRTFEQRDIQNRMNLPPHTPPPPPLMHRVTVGQAVEALLHELITPTHASPHAGRFKVYSTQMFSVADWKAFWARREGTTLEAIRASLEPAADRYWQAHGTTQPIE